MNVDVQNAVIFNSTCNADNSMTDMLSNGSHKLEYQKMILTLHLEQAIETVVNSMKRYLE